ncbi:MAG: hypothetical protein AAGI63_11285 [Planctomycetota bacterium]
MTILRFVMHALIVLTTVNAPTWSQDVPEPGSPEPVLSIPVRGKSFPRGLQFSDDGSTLWINSLDGWSVDTGKKVLNATLAKKNISSPIIDIANQTMLIASRKSGNVLLWRENGQPVERELSQTGEISTARLIDQGERFALVFIDPPSVYFGSADTDKDDSITPLPFQAYRCEVAPDGNLLAIREGREVKIWDLERQEERAVLKHKHKPFSHVFSDDSCLLATGTSNDNIVRIFDTKDGKLLAELSGHGRGTIFLTSAIYSLAFSPDGKQLVSGGHDGRVIVWDVITHQPILKLKVPGPPIVSAVAFSPDSKSVACCFENAGAKRGIRVWKIRE